MFLKKHGHTILRFAVTIMLLYDYNTSKFTPKLEHYIYRPQFNVNTPYIEVKKDHFNVNYSKLVDFDFKFRILSYICKHDETYLLVIVVSSNLYNWKKRNVIRELWGQANDAIKIVFFVGMINDSKWYRFIVKENDVYNDIVQGNFLDNYRNLTYKFVMELKWVTHHCPTARYILKIDDDTFINYRELMKFLVRELSPWGVQKLIACVVQRNTSVFRKDDAFYDPKWIVSKHEYASDVYPDYCSGAFVLFSQDVIPLLLEKSETTKFFFIDDVYVPGILVNNIGLPLADLSYLYLRREDLVNHWKWGKRIFYLSNTFMFGPVNLTPEEIQMLYQSVN